jgi:hypothetical protein
MQNYFFVAGSELFLIEQEPLEELLKERRRYYGEQGKEVDFWLVRRPAFLESADLTEQAAAVPRPAAAVISTDARFIDFMKLRLESVLKGSFSAPSATIPDPLAGSA